MGGLAAPLSALGVEIRGGLKRSPDSGDLLLVLACAPDTRAAAALSALGVNLDALSDAVAQARAQASPSEDELQRELEDVRRKKQQAAALEQYETAAELRNEEQVLGQALARIAVSPEAIEQIRSRLGLPSD